MHHAAMNHNLVNPSRNLRKQSIGSRMPTLRITLKFIASPVHPCGKLLRELLALVGLDALQLLLDILVDRIVGILVLRNSRLRLLISEYRPRTRRPTVRPDLFIVVVSCTVGALAEVAAVADGPCAREAAREAGRPTSTQRSPALACEG